MPLTCSKAVDLSEGLRAANLSEGHLSEGRCAVYLSGLGRRASEAIVPFICPD